MRKDENIAFTLADIAQRVSGKVIGDSQHQVSKLLPIEEADSTSLTLFTGKSYSKFEQLVSNREVGGVLMPLSFEAQVSGRSSAALPDAILPNIILVDNPMRAFIVLARAFSPAPLLSPKIHQSAVIAESARLEGNISVGPFCVIGENCEIGEGSILHPGVILYADVIIEPNCVLHSGVTVREGCRIRAGSVIQNGAVIGADGFGYMPGPKGLEPVPQIGIVDLGPSVDVGANSCIDRATMGETRISHGTKIDNLVQIGHNVQIGANSILCGQVGVAGSAKIGSQVVLGGGVGVADHLEIADGCRFAGHSALTGDITEKGDYAGYPALPARQWKRAMAALARLSRRK